MSLARSNPARGRPLIVLAAMLLGWIGMRFALWPQDTLQALERALPSGLLAEMTESPKPQMPASIRAPSVSARSIQPSRFRFARWDNAPLAPPMPVFMRAIGQPAEQVAAHDLLWIAAVTRGEYGYPAPAIASNLGPARSVHHKRVPEVLAEKGTPDRWTFDSWLLWRPVSRGTAAVAPAAYGASQAGALISYRLAPGIRWAPRVYARATGFPEGASNPELAAGVSVNPIAGLPVRAQVELRARERSGRAELRPAVMLVGGGRREVFGLEADAYGQIGYVGGGDATLFADGKLTLRKAIAAGGSFRLAAGVGAWGGAQQDASRVDVGPSASLTLSTGPLTARLEADYRIRVAGEAKPGSGPALTVAASF